MLACVSTCGHSDICWYVPTSETTLSTSDTNHLKLILHAGMCQQIGTCRYVLICAGMCWHVPTCANMWHYSRHLWWRSFRSYLHAGMCQHLWTCRHVLICADMCQHVKPPSSPLISTIWNLSWMLACVSTFGHANICWYVPTCAEMCWHVPTCANMWH